MEPFPQAALGRVSSPEHPVFFGQPRERTEAVAAEEGKAGAETRDAVTPPSGGGEIPEDAAAVFPGTPTLAVEGPRPETRVLAGGCYASTDRP